MDKFECRDGSQMTVAEIDAALARISERLENIAPEAKKESAVSTSARGKMILSCAIMIIAVVSMVLSSFAYFTATTYSSKNVIATGSVSVEFVDLNTPAAGGGSAGTELDPIRFMPGYVEVRRIYASNKGSIPIYVRASIDTSITLADRYASHSDEVDTSLVMCKVNGGTWVEKDGYYYYSAPLLDGETTPELLDHIEFSREMGNIYKDSTVRVKIVFEMVQASNNGDTPFEAVGWITDSKGGAA